LKTVFEKSDTPTGENNFPERFAAVFQVAVPGEGHEDVGNSEQRDRSHFLQVLLFNESADAGSGVKLGICAGHNPRM